jgi:hypothetical protein
MMNWFEIKLKEYPRTWKKEQWKRVYSWLRECGRIIKKEIE